MTKTQAIAKATTLVSPVYRATPGPTGWGYNSWDATRRAWWTPSQTFGCFQAQALRADEIAREAILLHLGLDHSSDEAFTISCEDPGRGTIGQKFDRLLKAVRS